MRDGPAKRSFAGREALPRESRTGCQGRQPRGNYEARGAWQDAGNNLAAEAQLCRTRGTASRVSNGLPGKAAPGELRSKRRMAGRRQQPRSRSAALQDARHCLASLERAAREGSPGGTTKQEAHGRMPATTPQPKRSFAGREALLHVAHPVPPLYGRSLRERAPSLLLRCDESRTGFSYNAGGR